MSQVTESCRRLREIKRQYKCPGVQPPGYKTIKKRVYCGKCGRLLGEYPPETQMAFAVVCPCYKEDHRELQET